MIFLRLCLDLLPPLALGTGKLLPELMDDEKLESVLALNPRYSVLSPTSFIGYQFTNILRFNRGHRR